MRFRHLIPAALTVGVLYAAPWRPGDARAAATQTFDGAWSVEVDCPDVGDVSGYDWRFSANVSSGALTGSYHSPTTEAMGQLTGRIGADGEALLTLVGRTGPVPMSIGHVRPGTPFRYTANVHFDARSGFGKRNERRACTLTFTKS
jgi:hypothetical protein